MSTSHISKISSELNLSESQVAAVAQLLDQDATVPFIARYRKEATGSLDEVAITAIRDRIKQLFELEARKEAVLKSLQQHGHLTDELNEKVSGALTISELEDIYLPYKPKRRTRATIAREKGLEPLALLIIKQTGIDPAEQASAFIDPEKGVGSVDDALSGARDIISEIINEHSEARAKLRLLFATKGTFHSRVIDGMETSGTKYKDYFDWQEPVTTAPSHRILAMRRGENEDILNLGIAPPEEVAVSLLDDLFVTGDGKDASQVRLAVRDSYKRLLSRSMETEIRVATKERADAEAIDIFAENLRQLLLSPPLGPRRVMGIDPGFRTGCKAVCLDPQGKLLHYDTFYLHMSEKQSREAAEKIKKLCSTYQIEAIAVGNGTAGRETEAFIKSLPFIEDIQIVMVNESGASIYSASETAREEFPDLDLTIRGAVSIGRRLMDPLSELVKIDAKSIGVGQYQHDVDQSALKQALDDVVISCVNGVGVDVNRASVQLLTYVSGLGTQLARNIVTYRNENGPFLNREQLKKVPRLGPKAFEQCAGFLRILDGENPLDGSAVHPESYPVVYTMATDLACTVKQLIQTPSLRNRLDISRYVTEAIGIPTLRDILAELAKPGRDPRDTFESVAFKSEINEIKDLTPDMQLPGIITNVTAFGAFVDIGVHQDGLVHISQLSDRFVKNPADIVKVNQKVTVTVLEVDLERNRISLSMKTTPEQKKPAKAKPVSSPPKKKSDKHGSGSEKNGGHSPFNNPFADIFKKN
ncbi:MAG: Tex family protein [Desulfobacterales bacterium]|nr:Tex family protein [Desulfobacterales bacterium]MDD4072056.1 Tex family protein [Desulfobacterales bacterium]MDD4393377.1 Tex family protein [Desulfobacterales bacterium]